MCGKLKKWIFDVSTVFILVFVVHPSYSIPYIQGVDYIPQHYHANLPTEDDNQFISDNDIEKDFFTMSKNFNAVRTYQYDPINLQRILRTAKRYDMKVAIGLKIDSTKPVETEKQIQGLNKMFEQYPELKSPVITIVVGNNVIRDPTRYFSKENVYLLKQIKQISQFKWFLDSTINLSISESDEILMSNAGIQFLGQISKLKIRERISLLVSINPYLSGCNVSEAIGQSKTKKCESKSFPARWKQLMARKEIKDFQVIIGETGWPTDGPGSKGPIQTVPGNLSDAIQYYQFLYPFLENKVIRGANISVPFFVFSAFDEPDNGIFGFSSNYWGVYKADCDQKPGMIYPIQNRIVKPTPKLGTNIRIYLPSSSPYAKLPVLFKTDGHIYSNIIPDAKTDKTKVYSFIDNYPFVKFSLKTEDKNGDHIPNIVTLVLPNGGDKLHKAAICTNELISGIGYGLPSKMSLKWKNPRSKEENCQNIIWGTNGLWIN